MENHKRIKKKGQKSHFQFQLGNLTNQIVKIFRRTFAGMLYKLDESVGLVVDALKVTLPFFNLH